MGLSEASSPSALLFWSWQRYGGADNHYFFFDQHRNSAHSYDFWIEGTFLPAGDYTLSRELETVVVLTERRSSGGGTGLPDAHQNAGLG